MKQEIETKQMGEVWIASCGKNTAIGISEEEAVKGVKFQLKNQREYIKKWEGIWAEK